MSYDSRQPGSHELPYFGTHNKGKGNKYVPRSRGKGHSLKTSLPSTFPGMKPEPLQSIKFFILLIIIIKKANAIIISHVDHPAMSSYQTYHIVEYTSG